MQPVVLPNTSLRKTMEVIGKSGFGIAIVIKEETEEVLGVISDGDIRRAILDGIRLEEDISQIYITDFIYATEDEPYSSLAEIMVEKSINQIPILDKQGHLVEVAIARKLLEDTKVKSISQLKIHDVKKVLIIGGAGYIGSHLSRILLDKGLSVRVFDKLVYGTEGIKELQVNPNFELISGDIRNLDEIMNAMFDVDAVVHLAAIVGDPASKLLPHEAIVINYVSSIAIASLCKYLQINRFIFASTCSVYGKTDDKLISEEGNLNPLSLYAVTKVETEKALKAMENQNFKPTILRFSTIYGLSERMRFDLAANIMTAHGYFNKKIKVFGGEQWRPFLHVYDAANAIVSVLTSPFSKIEGEIFNVGSNNQNFQIKDIALILKDLIPNLEIETTDEGDHRDYSVSFSKIEELLQFKPKHTLEEGIEEILETLKKGKYKDYRDKKYSNFLLLKSDGIEDVEKKITFE